MLKRIISFGVFLAIAFSLCACGGTAIWYNEIYQGTRYIANTDNQVYAVYETENNSDEDFEDALSDTVSSITSMLVSKGYTEALVQREGTTHIRISISDIGDAVGMLRIIGTSTQIKFVLDGGETVLTGKEVVSARAQYSSEGMEYVVALSLNSEGAKKFADTTANNIGATMHIITIIGGEELTVSSPNIYTAITNGQAVITGMGTGEAGLKRAEELAGQIAAGKLPLSLSLLEIDTIDGEVNNFTSKLIKSKIEADAFNLFKFSLNPGDDFHEDFDELFFENYALILWSDSNKGSGEIKSIIKIDSTINITVKLDSKNPEDDESQNSAWGWLIKIKKTDIANIVNINVIYK